MRISTEQNHIFATEGLARFRSYWFSAVIRSLGITRRDHVLLSRFGSALVPFSTPAALRMEPRPDGRVTEQKSHAKWRDGILLYFNPFVIGSFLMRWLA